MKSLQTTLLLILLTNTISISQEFAPIGAKWYVEVAEPFAPEWLGTLTNESIGDTILKGLSCKVLFKSQATIFNEIQGEYILCQEGDSIYHYIESLDSLNLIMDFGAEVGSSWESFDRANEYESFGTQRNYKYTVDSISYFHLVNQDSLKIQHLSVLQKDWGQPDSEYKFNNQTEELIEKIGFKSALLPTNGGDGFTDDQFETDVRCYQDNIIGLVKLTGGENCITTSTKEITIKDFIVSPNPTNGIVQIEGLAKLENMHFVITNLSGQIVADYKSVNKFDIGHLANGIYLLNIIGEDLIFSKKLVLSK